MYVHGFSYGGGSWVELGISAGTDAGALALVDVEVKERISLLPYSVLSAGGEDPVAVFVSVVNALGETDIGRGS